MNKIADFIADYKTRLNRMDDNERIAARVDLWLGYVAPVVVVVLCVAFKLGA